jgi:hypothetical protein
VTEREREAVREEKKKEEEKRKEEEEEEERRRSYHLIYIMYLNFNELIHLCPTNRKLSVAFFIFQIKAEKPSSLLTWVATTVS